MTQERGARWIGHLVGSALLIAAVLNGAGAFAKRVGVCDRTAYERYWIDRCDSKGTEPVWAGLGRRCASPGWISHPSRRSGTEYVVAVRPWEWPMKLVKDIVTLGMIGYGVLSACRRRGRGDFWRRRWLLGLLGIHVFALAIAGAVEGEPLRVLAGLRSFGYLPVALLWAPLLSRDQLEIVASWLLALLCIQCALVPWELLYGITDRPFFTSIRTAGTLVHPNSLGALAVSVLGFGLSYARGRRQVVLLWLVTLVLVAAAGSGIGWVALGMLAFVRVMRPVVVSPMVKVAGAIAVMALLLSTLTTLTGRPDILASVVEGRLMTLRRIAQQSPAALMLGTGIGRGTNTATTALGQTARPLDSTVAVLVVQGGLIALILFYAALLQAWWRHRGYVLLSILVVSFAANILETFPIGMLMGIALARSLQPSADP